MKKILPCNPSVLLLLALMYGNVCFSQTNEQRDSVKESSFEHWLTNKPKGLYNITSFSIVSERGNLFSGMQSSVGYKFNPHLGIGGGVGIERFTNLPTYDAYSTNFTLMPVFAEIRYTMLKSRVTPVIALQCGYKFLINRPWSQTDYTSWWLYPGLVINESYIWDEYDRGGMFLTGEIGVNFRIYQRFGIYAALTYSLWSVTGKHYHEIVQTIFMNSPPVVKEWLYTDAVKAYQHIFLFRVGFSF